jgi:hypothetical protein
MSTCIGASVTDTTRAGPDETEPSVSCGSKTSWGGSWSGWVGVVVVVAVVVIPRGLHRKPTPEIGASGDP